MIVACPDCGSRTIRTFAVYNEKSDRWEWWKGCNDCPFESRDTDEEVLHPEYYSRTEFSPAKINSQDIQLNQ